MSRTWRLGLSLVVVLLFVGLSHSAPPLEMLPPQAARVPGFDSDKWVNANSFFGSLTNFGVLFSGMYYRIPELPGSVYPYTSIDDIESGANSKSPIFSSGLWIAGIANGQLGIVDATFQFRPEASEYVPGPMAGSMSLPSDTSFHVYKLFSDSLESNPNQDYLNWPIDQGAPLDSLGRPLSRGNQTLWSVFNNADSLHSWSSTPLGIEIQQTVFANSGSPVEDHGAYIQYKLYNKGGKSITDMYIAFWVDPDIGKYSDDMVGCDTVSGTVFAYNAYDYDSIYGFEPPAVGVKALAGPVVPSVGDTALFDGKKLYDFRNMPMSAVAAYNNGYDPISDTTAFNYIRGLNRDGTDYLYSGTPLRFMRSGNPLTGQGDVDTLPPADRRILMSFGPLSFNPGDSQQVLLKVAAGQGADNISAINVMNYHLGDNSITPCATVEASVRDFGAITGFEFSPSSQQWLEGVNWGGNTLDGGIGYGKDFFGSSLDPATSPESFVNVEIRFSDSVRQKAFRYEAPFFNYVGYDWVPFTVWDIDGQRQLNAAFVEWVGSATYDGSWNLDLADLDGGREYLLVFNSLYGGDIPNTSPVNYPLLNLKNDAGQIDALYSCWLALDSSHSIADLKTGQVLSIKAQTETPNGIVSQVNFRDTHRGDTSYQRIALGCNNGFLSEATLVFEDPSVFGLSQVAWEHFTEPAPRILQIREIANGSGPVSPPMGRDLITRVNSTGDWMVSRRWSSCRDSSGHTYAHDWEIRFTEPSWGYKSSDGSLFGLVPFSVWDIGSGTPNISADDHQVTVAVRDDDGNGVWSFDDDMYISFGSYRYDSIMPNVPRSWATYGAIEIELHALDDTLTVPEYGTIIRISEDHVRPTAPDLPNAENDPERVEPASMASSTLSPNSYDWGYTVQFTPNRYGSYQSSLEVKDPTTGQILSTIPLFGRTYSSCCEGTTGNVNGSGIVDLSDLTGLVSYLIGSGFEPRCLDASNISGTGIVDLADLSALVSYLTGGGYVLPNCT